MPIIDDWTLFYNPFVNEINSMKRDGLKPPEKVLELLKTDKLVSYINSTDGCGNDDIDKVRKLQSKVQKFMFKYGGSYKKAKAAVKKAKNKTQDQNKINALDNLDNSLNMLNVSITRVQNGVFRKAESIIDAAIQAEADAEIEKALKIKKALSVLRFKSDWDAGKDDFETVTGKKKPSKKTLEMFRKSAGLDNALGDLDKACKQADPIAYKDAWYTFYTAQASYLEVLKDAIDSADKPLDQNDLDDPKAIYIKKLEGLRDLLISIKSRVDEKIRRLDEIDQEYN